MLATCALILALAVAAPPPERLAEVSVHGNTITPDDEILRLAQVSVGMPADDQLAAAVADRLRATKRFEHVEVLKRFASIADPSEIVLVIVVDEGPIQIKTGPHGADPHVVKGRNARPMIFPILDYEDGYGLSYGVRFAFPNALGRGTRVSVPLSLGGEKRAAIELDRPVANAAVTRLQAGAGVSQRTQPYFEETDSRRAVWARAERRAGKVFRAGANAAFERVSFGGDDDRFARLGADAVLDTRVDPFLARNAVYARVAWDRLSIQHSGAVHRIELDGRGYVGLVRQTVLAVRVVRQDSNRPLPAYLQPLLGGTANLRGFRAGTAAGDTLVATSAELRVPLSSPLKIAKLGVSGFIDAGTVYRKGERLRDQELRRGVGGGVWMSATVLRLSLDVAHGFGASTRVQAGATLSF